MKRRTLTKATWALAALITAGVAQAGPQVTIVFKNNGTVPATFSPASSAEFLTRSAARQTPEAQVAGGGVSSYRVTSSYPPAISNATVRYTIGSKICVFKTSYINSHVRGGTIQPRWNKSETSSGGARCDARISSTNPADHSWVVEFTMR